MTVRRALERKKATPKNIEGDRLERNKREYLKARKKAGRVVANAKAEKYQKIYNELETREGERKYIS